MLSRGHYENSFRAFAETGRQEDAYDDRVSVSFGPLLNSSLQFARGRLADALDLDRGADRFEGLADFLGFVFVNPLFDSPRSAVDQRLGFLEA